MDFADIYGIQAEKMPDINKIFDKLSVACCCFNNKGVLLTCNLAWARLFALEKKSEAKKKFVKLFSKESHKIIADGVKVALAEGSARVEAQCVTAVGEKIFLDIQLTRESDGVVMGNATDITKYKRWGANSDSVSMSRWTAVLDTLPVGVNIYDDNHTMLDVNQTMLRQFDCKSKEEYKERWMDTLPEFQNDGRLTLEFFEEALQKTFELGEDSGQDWQMQTIHGEPIPMHISSVVVPEGDHKLLITYTTDLRPLRAAMDKAREEEQFSHTLFESSPHGVSIWDSNHKIISVNRQLIQMCGAVDAEDFYDNFADTYIEYQPNGLPSRESFQLYLRRAFDGETVRFEWMTETLQHESLPLEITFVRYRKGLELFVAAYTVDLRDVKATMAKLHEADERAQILISALPIPSALLSPDYQVVECNQAAVSLLAKSPGKPFEYFESEDFETYYCHGNCGRCGLFQLPSCIARRCLIRNWRHTFEGYKENREHVAEFIERQCLDAAEKGFSVQTSYFRSLVGEEIFVETTLVPVKYKGERGFALYMRDLREARLREVAEEESRAKTRFLAQMSHEIRTPMNAVLGISEIQLQKEHSPDTEEAFARIHHSSQLLLSIINDILDLSKVEAGKMEIVPQPYELSDMLIATVQLNMMHIGRKKIELKLEIDETLPRTMEGDELRIKQIMNNLMSNAFKYTPEGTVTLRMSGEIRPQDDDLDLIIEITDTGQGMTKSQLNTLFELEFNRLNLHQNRDIQGSGLGMTITYHLVNMMNGTIFADSTPGKGSKFIVRLPQKIAKKEPLGALAAELQDVEAVKNSMKKIVKIDRENLKHGSVLIVDDVESNLFVASGLLAPYKLAVDTVMSGLEALEKIQSGKVYDIIFMDHMMPGMDGIEATRRIREEGYVSPIVALTANILVGQEEMFLANGFNNFVSKPIDPNKLDECLMQYIKNPALKGERANNATSCVAELSDALVSSFLRDAEKVTKVLADIYISQDWCEDNIRLHTINTHAMKSALANVNEAALSDIAYSLEEAGRANNIDKLQSETGLFLEDLAKIVEKLTPKKAPDTPDEDPDFLQGQLKIICIACDKYNKKAAKAALTALSKKSWSNKTTKLLDEISATLLHSEFEAAAELAQHSFKID